MRTFEMNGKQYTSITAMAKELGKSRIYAKDFDKYGIVETTDKVAADESEETTTDNHVEELPFPSEPINPDDVGITEEELPDTDNNNTNEATDNIDDIFVGYAEELQKQSSKDINEFSKYIKGFTDESLIKAAEEIGVNTWNTITNESIRRMRLLMEIKNHFYHYLDKTRKTTTKKESCWKSLSLQELMKIAKKNKVSYKVSDNEGIQRMWITVALNEAGIKPEGVTNA